jgi:ankyrin repeat protein
MSRLTPIIEALLGLPRRRWYAWRWSRKLRRLHRSAGLVPMSDRQIQDLLAAEDAALGPRTPADDLCDAAGDGNLAEVKRLLADGVSPDAVDRRGNRPLHQAEDVEVIRLLLDSGATIAPNEGWTLLHMWVDATCDVMHQLNLPEPELDDMEILRLLLAHGADPHTRDPQHGMPLDVARRYQCEPVIRLLESHRAPRGGTTV